MADCQDLVDSVNNLRVVMESILEELQFTRAVAIESKEVLTLVEAHLGFRLTSRAYQRAAHDQVILALNAHADIVAERIAQHSQLTSGASTILATDVPDILVADPALDVDTPGA